jgi:hypothetical protein
MNLNVSIEFAENSYKKILEDFFKTVYDEKSLYSHGIDHHRRVWRYAKELALLLSDKQLIDDSFSPSGLIIACYLHDIGMSVDRGIIHGHHSREICTGFLEKNSLRTADWVDVLEAIENHDNKEYKTFSGKHNLPSVLSVADDLDAFGFAGIYRYSEIYLMRGINPSELGHLVIKNARKRFENFRISYDFSGDLIMKHKTRFEILGNFFNEYNEQATTYTFGSQHPSGYCGAIELLNNLICKNHSLTDFLMNKGYDHHDKIIKRFFDELKSELFE